MGLFSSICLLSNNHAIFSLLLSVQIANLRYRTCNVGPLSSFMFAKALVVLFLTMILIYELHIHMNFLQLQVDQMLDFVIARIDNLIGASI